jgi:hypothetical protein
VEIAHNDGFHGVAVAKLPKVLIRAVLLGDLLSDHFWRTEAELIRKLFAEGGREVRHPGK